MAEPSLWARYRAEVCETKFIEQDGVGFISYSVLENGVLYLEDIYVIPGMRGEGFAHELIATAENIGRELGCKTSMALICLASKTCVESLKAHLTCGFVPFSTEPGKIWLKRSITTGE